MTSTIISLAIVGVILISAAYFLFKQSGEKSNTDGTIGNSNTNTEDINDTSGRGGISNDSNN